MITDEKRMQLLSMSKKDLVERVCFAETLWIESVKKRDALEVTIAQKDAEIERLRGVLRGIVDRGYTGASYVAQKALEENND